MVVDGGGAAATLDDYGALRDNKKIIARSLSRNYRRIMSSS